MQVRAFRWLATVGVALAVWSAAGCGPSAEELRARARVTELEGQLHDSEQQRQDLETRLHQLEDQNQQMADRLSALGQDVEGLRAERTSLSAFTRCCM